MAKIVTSFRIPEDLSAWLTAHAAASGVDRTEVVTDLLLALREGRLVIRRVGAPETCAEVGAKMGGAQASGIGGVVVRVVTASGAKPKIRHMGAEYVLVEKPEEYHIELVNHDAYPRLVVLTVDGVNVVDGQPGSANGPGYIVRAGSTAKVMGWLRTDREVAGFRFASAEGSYTAQIGQGTNNVGVIGAFVYAQAPILAYLKHPAPPTVRHPTPLPTFPTPLPTFPPDPLFPEPTLWWSGAPPEWRSGTGSPYRATLSATSSTGSDIGASLGGEVRGSMGTAYGAQKPQRTERVDFAPGGLLTTILVYYGGRERLTAWGVPPEREPHPVAFPAGESVGFPFVPAPPGWRG